MKHLLTLLLFLIATSANAATYYVAPVASGGADTNAGTLAAPWATLNHANAIAVSGDTVYVRGGSYTQTMYADKAGVAWRNYTGETPIIDGGWPGTVAGDSIGLPTGTNRYSALVFIAGSNITFDGFEVRNSRGRGVEVAGNAITGNTVKNCKIHHCYMECLIVIGEEASSGWVTNQLVEWNDIFSGAMFRKLSGAQSSDSPGQVLLTRFNGLTFRYNKVHDSYYDGILVGGNVRGTYASTNCIVEYNQIYGNYQDQLVFTSCHNNTARYNLIYGTYPNANGEKGRGSGIWFANETGWNMGICDSQSYVYGNMVAYTFVNIWIEGQTEALGIKNVNIYNNTSIDAYSSNFYVSWTTSTGIVLKNNIIIQNEVTPVTTLGWAAAGTVTADYNLWSTTPSSANLIGAHDPTYAGIPTTKTSGWGTLTSGQLVGSEFALREGTVAIDHGTTITAVTGQTFDKTLKLPGFDFSNIGTVTLLDRDDNGSAWDIGAGEWEVIPTSPCNRNATCDDGETYLLCPDECSAPAASATAVYIFPMDSDHVSGSTLTNTVSGGANGTISGGVTATDYQGTAGGARAFDGSTGYITADPVNVTGAGGFSYSVWVKQSARATGWDSHVMGTASNYARTTITSGGYPRLITYSTAGHWLVSPSTIPIGEWTHLAATYDGANARLYVNGELVASGAIAGPSANDTSFTIGRATSAWSDKEYFSGSMRDARAYTGALTNEEVAAIYAAGVGTPETPPDTSCGIGVTLSNGKPSAGQWRIDSGAWQSSGAVVTGLAPGTYTVSFQAVDLWNSPAPRSVTLTTGQTVSLTEAYSAVLHGYTAPANATVTIVAGETASITGTYTLAPAGVRHHGVAMHGVTFR